ncbi:MAG: hypothetical protein KTR18_00180 [Acidiferrobacterales bacterium]|nr:hypothetical protein [Acidiferrobacterales bacterium]
MSFHLKISLLSLLILLLTGCVSAPKEEIAEPEPIPENPAILQAEIDLAQAKTLNAEWRVRLNPGDAQTQNLSTILELAKQAHETGEADLATELAQKVTQFARLGIAQATGQQNVSPYYPQ